MKTFRTLCLWLPGFFLGAALFISGCTDRGNLHFTPNFSHNRLPSDIDRFLDADSVIKRLSGSSLNTGRHLDSLLILSDLLKNYQDHAALKYAKAALQLSQAEGWNLARAYSSYYVAMLKGRQEIFGEGIEDALVDASIALRSFEGEAMPLWEARSHILLGNFHYRQNQYDSAWAHLNKALALVDKGGTAKQDSLTVRGEVFHEMAVLSKTTDPEKADELFKEGLSLYQKAGNQLAKARIQLDIGRQLGKDKKFDAARTYILQSLAYAESQQDLNGLVLGYQYLGDLHVAQYRAEKEESHLNQGLLYYQSCLPLQKENLYYTYDRIGIAFQYKAQATGNLLFIDSSLVYYKKAMEEARNEGVLSVMKHMANNIANLCSFLEYNTKKECTAILGISTAALFNNNYTGIVDTITQSLQSANQRIREFELSEAEAVSLKNRRNLMLAGFAVFLASLLGFLVWRSRQVRTQLKKERLVNERLQQVDRLKDQFLANTSHELRTPLNGIIGLSESLIDRTQDLSQKEDLSLIVSSGKRLSNLVNELLDFSRLKNYDLQLQQKPVDLRSLSEVVLRVSAPLAQGKDLQLLNSIPPDLPAVFADENRLQQVLYNLIGNAIKFTDTGSVEIGAQLRDTGQAEVRVTDTGIGIPREKHEEIFQEFHQADGSISRRYGGTGLGLTVSRELVRLHGGDMGVESDGKNGSSFWFTLPTTDATPKKSEQANKPPVATLSTLREDRQQESKVVALPQAVNAEGSSGPPPASSHQHKIRILLVDDEPINLQVLRNHLQTAGIGYELFTASNGEEALKQLRQNGKFDLVLLDVMMPRMSGYEVCEKIRERYLPSELPIIMVTAKNQIEDLVQGLQLGANDYLAKPFSKQEFLARVQTQLDLHLIFSITDRFVPNEFIRFLGRDRITEIQLGDQTEKEVSVVFCDIRGYTTLAETMTPDETFKFVNSFHGRTGPIILKNKGFVNQYLGDGFMALFPQEPADALQASIEMMHSLHAYNLEREAKNRLPIHIGIGIHFGPLIMGVIGDDRRMDAATISDVVNTASRVESLNKHFGSSLLCSEEVVSQIPDTGKYTFRYLGPVQVKGKKESVRIYECINGDPAETQEKKQASLRLFEAGTQHYFSAEFKEAIQAFEAICIADPADRVAQHFLQKSLHLLKMGVGEGWTGVEEMVFK